uniref:Uncharacterized protein n=1 Tax=Rhizophora mucronata TaxID=61149 RepID=A0A2P2KXG5_RHIMU
MNHASEVPLSKCKSAVAQRKSRSTLRPLFAPCLRQQNSGLRMWCFRPITLFEIINSKMGSSLDMICAQLLYTNVYHASIFSQKTLTTAMRPVHYKFQSTLIVPCQSRIANSYQCIKLSTEILSLIY